MISCFHVLVNFVNYARKLQTVRWSSQKKLSFNKFLRGSVNVTCTLSTRKKHVSFGPAIPTFSEYDRQLIFKKLVKLETEENIETKGGEIVAKSFEKYLCKKSQLKNSRRFLNESSDKLASTKASFQSLEANVRKTDLFIEKLAYASERSLCVGMFFELSTKGTLDFFSTAKQSTPTQRKIHSDRI